MVVAPRSTFDLSLASGAAMPLEQRDGRELLCFQNQTVAAQGADSFNPVFDLTPAALIDAMVSERGVILQPDAAKIAAIIS
jgi:methylthioribose-1-phosphate isomerase